MKKKAKTHCYFIKWVLSIFVLSLLVKFQFAEANILSIKGKGNFPYFDHQGNLRLVYINPEGGLSLAKLPKEDDIQKISTQDIDYGNNIHSVRVKKDKSGKTWLVWEERESIGSDIYTAQLKNDKITHLKQVTADQNGYNVSPSIDFSYGNEPWLVWVNYSQNKYRILAKNLTTEQTWQINSSSTSSALNPQIIVDGTDKTWIFYVGQLRNHDEILYTHFDGQSWEAPLSLNRNPDVPHINPSLALDFNGFPHVVWSAFDGEDYELYYSRWDGNRWHQERRITNNQNTADTSPSLSLLMDTIPVVAWQRYKNGERQLSLTFRMDDRWITEINISRVKSPIHTPKLVSFGSRIAVVWQGEEEIKTTLFHFYDAYTFPSFEKRDVDSTRILALSRDKYIGYGDSITYGYITNEPAPDKGYIPRLEELIDENIEDSEVVNRGVGGEKTAEGLSRINSALNEDQARTMFLMEGTNDVKDYDISTDTTAFNLKTMVERALDFGVTVFLASIIPKDPWEGILEERILDLNDKIKAIVTELNIHFVDQFKAFGSVHSGGILYSDATHPNEAGYQLLAETFYAALTATLPSIELDSTFLLFKARIGEQPPAAQTFKIKNSGAGRLSYEINASEPWISLTPTSGDSTGGWDEITVSVDVSNLIQGAYTGEVTVTADYIANSPQVITIELSISSPIIEVDKTSLSFEATYEGTNPISQTLQIRNSGEGTLNYLISSEQDWMDVTPTSGASTGEWDEITVSVDISSLLRGVHRGEITITGENAPNSPFTITVELNVTGSHIQIDRSSLPFEGVKGGPNPKSRVFKVKNGGEGTLNYQIATTKNWIQVSPASGASTGEWDRIRVSVDISLLSAGTHQGKVRIKAENTSNSPRVLTINLVILSPIIKLNKSSLNFKATAGEPNPPAQVFTLQNSGAGTLHYQITANRDWINVNPTSGTSTGEKDQIQVSVNIASLSAENSEGLVTVTAENASNSPQRLNIFLHLLRPPLFSPVNFRGEKKTNRSLSQLEYINVLAWDANSKNNFIVRYKIYLVEEGQRNLLTVVDSETFEYWHRSVEKDKMYRYGLTAVDVYGRESEPTYVDVG